MSVTISLALQGGGAHGAFTWGVLDRLLEDGGIAIEGISGTSAGAINACVMAHGLLRGRDAAREELAAFWQGVARAGAAAFNPYHTTPLNSLPGLWNLDQTPVSYWMDVLAMFVSPYQLNPMNLDPLRDLLRERIDFGRLRGCTAVRLFVCATNVRTNKMRIFETSELSLEALLGSTCVPQLRQAVDIEERGGTEAYWDGGFIGNPVLKPLIRRCRAGDVIIVKINPIRRPDVPRTARDIQDRLNEVTFNAALMRELDVIAMINRWIEQGVIGDGRFRTIRLHAIDAADEMVRLGVRSKQNTAWTFLCWLRDLGRARTEAWLGEHRADLGRRATLDLAEYAV
jgi:NTE family protein